MSVFVDLLGDRVVATLFVTFLHTLWQGALVAGVAWAGLWALRDRRPEARYAWSVASLAILVALPLVTAAWVSRPTADPGPPPVAIRPSGIATGAPETPGPADAAAESHLRADARGTPLAGDPPAPGPTLADRAAPWIAALWLLGALALLARNLGGWLLVRHRILERGSPVDDPWPGVLRDLAVRLKIRRPVRLLASDDVPVPLVAGWLRPIVVVPASLMTGVSAGTIEALLAHELAHVRRHDYLVNLLQIAAESALFFHPAVWWLSTRIRDEREHCCDEVAARAVGERITYARALVEVAGRLSGRRLVAASGGSLLERVRRLTDADPRSPLPSPWAGAALIVSVPLALAVGAWAPAVPGPVAPTDVPEAGAPADPAAVPSRAAGDAAPPAVATEAGSLAARWARAIEDLGTSGGWIAWGVTGSAEGTYLVDGASAEPSDEDDVSSARDRLGEAIGPAGAILVFGFDPGAPAGNDVPRVRLRAPDAPLHLDGRPLRWLGPAPDGESVALLERLIAATSDPDARAEMAAALSLHADGGLAAASVARLLAREPDPEVRAEAIAWLDRHSGRDVYELMRSALEDDPAPEVRRAVLSSIDEPAVRDTFDIEATLLAAIFDDPDRDVRADALDALEDLRSDAAGAGLRRVAREHPDAELRESAVQALEEYPGADRAGLLERIALDDPSPIVREAAFDVLSDLAPAAAVPGLRRIARDHPDARMRSAAVETLKDFGAR